jgi:aubergine-like protein
MDALLKYWETNHKWPKNVLVFRDGVSDGQMDTVERHEVQQFLRTFK